MAVVTQISQDLTTISLNSVDTRPSVSASRDFVGNESIVLIGSRGAGKRTLGFIGATYLGRRLITDDWYFQQETGSSKVAYLQKHGNSELYRRSVEVLGRMLDNNREGCIIECGISSLSSQAHRALRQYAQTNPVMYITRDSEHIRRLLRLGIPEAAKLEEADLAHRSCSNLEYYNLYDQSCDGSVTPVDSQSSNGSSRLKYAKEDFSCFLDNITGQGVLKTGFESPFSISALPPECRSYTYALSLRLSIIQDLELEELEAGADLVQLKVDAWSPNLPKIIGEQIATIRRKLCIPIIYHVEDYVFEGSQLSLTEQEAHYFRLLEHGLRFGVDYLVVDLKYSWDKVKRLMANAGRTKIIGQFLAKQDVEWSWHDPARVNEYATARDLGCKLIKFVRQTSKADDNTAVQAFLNNIDSIPDHLPVIAYNLGPHGRPSLVANHVFTPVTHPIMQSTISKSQVRQYLTTAREAMYSLYESRILDPLGFLILGGSVFYSLSPAMHTAAYEVCGLQNSFRAVNVSSLDEIDLMSRDASFGGAAITSPFKVQILDRLVAKSYHARAIGAVNTIIPLRNVPNMHLDGSTKSLLQQANNRGKSGPICAHYGDNTDWIGIMTCLRRNISPRNVVQPSSTTGLVIGAGGMARAAIYAMIQMGCRKVYIYNRTIVNAYKVAQHFNSWAAALTTSGELVHVIPSLEDDWPQDKFPTMIVSCVPARSVNSAPPSNFIMPRQWLGSPTGGVVAEMSYLPLDTPLLQQIRTVREETKQPWVIVDGLELLPEQAMAQFELMTGRKAPKRRIRMEVSKNYHLYRD